jgi:hypothetical protein
MKMINTAGGLFLLTLFFSCRTPRYIYSPAAPPIPFFQQKGESKLAATYANLNGTKNGEPTKNEGYDLQAAYAITDHWALTGSYFFRDEKDYYPFRENNYFDTSKVYYRRRAGDVGGGFFYPLDAKKNVVVDLYAGLGWGNFTIDDKGSDKNYLPYARFYHSRITQWYVHPGLHFFPGRPVSFAFTGRFSFVHYSGISTSYTDEELRYFELDKIKNKTLGFFEPSFILQAGVSGLHWVRAEGSLTLAAPMQDHYPQSRFFCGAIGLCFDLTKLRQKK